MSNNKIPLFNLNIKLKDWEGPFNDFRYFLKIAELANTFEKLHNGNFYVCKGGELKRGHLDELYTYEGDLDLDSPPPIHLHYGKKRTIADIFVGKKNKLCLSNIGAYPIYTLEGLYSRLPNKKINTKINSLCGELQKHTFFNAEIFLRDSLSKNKRTKLKILENKYKNLVLG